VGLKAKVNHFQADMHQRDQETIAPGKDLDSIQVVRHKPFYAAEVVLKSVDLRAMLATFPEPLKHAVLPPTDVGNGSKNKSSLGPEIHPLWLDNDDFVETDWCPSQHLPEIQLFPILSCPKLTYIKKNPSGAEIHAQNSKFGDEDTHTCLLGSEPCRNPWILLFTLILPSFTSCPSSRDFPGRTADCNAAADGRGRPEIDARCPGVLSSRRDATITDLSFRDSILWRRW
jgi:hypothetical protein